MTAIYKTQKLLKKSPHRKALRKLFIAVKHCFRNWKRSKDKQAPSRIITSHDEPLRIWIRKSDNIPIKGIQDPPDTFTKSESRIVQLFLSAQACFCRRTETNIRQADQDQHENVCRLVRNIFAKAKESDVIINVIRVLFSARDGNAMQILHRMKTDDTGEADENATENGQAQDEGANALRLSRTFAPRVSGEGRDTVRQATGDEGRSAFDDDGYDEDYESYETQRRQVAGVWVTLELPAHDKWPQFVESTFLLLEFLLTEHVALPYVGNGDHSHLSTSELHSSTERNMLDFTEHSLKLHETLARDLERYANPCTETCENRKAAHYKCRSRLKVSILPICRVSPILGTFCQELIKLDKPFLPAYRRLLKSIIAVLNYHIEVARIFFKNMEKHCSEQSKAYWRSWADPSIEEQADEEHQRSLVVSSAAAAEEELKEAESSGICFPGRKRVRPCILFKSKTEEMCNKKYKTSKSHSPGLLTVQCACDSPKLIGFVVMLQAESTATALSAVFSHFSFSPKLCTTTMHQFISFNNAESSMGPWENTFPGG